MEFLVATAFDGVGNKLVKLPLMDWPKAMASHDTSSRIVSTFLISMEESLSESD